MEIYCDSAATTALDPEVLDAMLPYLTRHYGNASSSHKFGKKAKDALEESRQTVADLLNVSSEDIFFTSGATEADNLAISGSIRTYDIQHVITSRIEHKAVLQILGQYSQEENLKVSFVKLDNKGNPDLSHLEELLNENPLSLVSLMHGNNEIGNLNNLAYISNLCQEYEAVFHSDTTQSIGKYRYNLKNLPLDFMVGSAHKFHGPKGAGFIYINKYRRIKPHILGGAQERGTRGGTENIAGIVGLAKALSLAYENFEKNQDYVLSLKRYFLNSLKNSGIADISFNGESDSPDKSLGNILSVAFPGLHTGGSLVSRLDAYDIAVSGGSACSNLLNAGSHVLRALQRNLDKDNVRFSFSRYNTFSEVDHIVSVIQEVYRKEEIFSKKTSGKSTLVGAF
ncbi:cysteine desulfurase [Pseudarcicella hirudinis]|uniref:cysteine desulfurase n=1 Tax=Pseudarcicella hirudinis TaxID=1079859 RepID=A0A1I5RIG7_9BACT|nr:cysteine desulfurase family protein [Pseudarcicella hirudinis]SFP58312.1 cysteine desulfurase [Pseudarcicella hirudinis]